MKHCCWCRVVVLATPTGLCLLCPRPIASHAQRWHRCCHGERCRPGCCPAAAAERERESKEALQQQKRKVTRQWEVLSKLKVPWRRGWACYMRLAASCCSFAAPWHATQASAATSSLSSLPVPCHPPVSPSPLPSAPPCPQKRFAALDRQLGEENQRLGEEYRRVARAFHALQAKARRSKEADRRRFAQARWARWARCGAAAWIRLASSQ